jgi:PhnB protein
MDMFWGDRMGQVTDPFGLKWTIATHVKDMTPEEQAKARDEAVAKMKDHKG